MEAEKTGTGKPAIWCGVLEADQRSVAVGVVVRTVRSQTTALCGREPHRSKSGRPDPGSAGPRK